MRRAVGVYFRGDDLGGGLEFRSPIKKEDFRNGEIKARGVTVRRKNQLITSIGLSKEALIVLRDLLNQLSL